MWVLVVSFYRCRSGAAPAADRGGSRLLNSGLASELLGDKQDAVDHNANP